MFRSGSSSAQNGSGFAPCLRRASVTGSSRVPNQNTIPIRRMTAAQTSATAFQPKATMMKGATNLVTAAPTLPAPKMPSATPCFSVGYQRET